MSESVSVALFPLNGADLVPVHTFDSGRDGVAVVKGVFSDDESRWQVFNRYPSVELDHGKSTKTYLSDVDLPDGPFDIMVGYSGHSIYDVTREQAICTYPANGVILVNAANQPSQAKLRAATAHGIGTLIGARTCLSAGCYMYPEIRSALLDPSANRLPRKFCDSSRSELRNKLKAYLATAAERRARFSGNDFGN